MFLLFFVFFFFLFGFFLFFFFFSSRRRHTRFSRDWSSDVCSSDLEVLEALDFIEEIHTKPLHQVPVGGRVAVIGGGNTAIDAVSQAKRLGAEKAILIYRRSEQDRKSVV